MRELKFRAWNESRKEYCYSGSWDHLSAFFAVHEQVCIFEQFTGLHDKNGKDIYEGDILHGREEGDGETTAWADVYFQIIYDEKVAGFMAHEIGIKDSMWDEQICELSTAYEVIENIHENPELLQE